MVEAETHRKYKEFIDFQNLNPKIIDLKDNQNSSGEAKESRWPNDRSNRFNLIFFSLALDRFRRQINSSSSFS